MLEEVAPLALFNDPSKDNTESGGNAEGDNPNFLKGFELTESSLDKYYDNAMDPQWNRLRQGRIPDCHFVASLQSEI